MTNRYQILSVGKYVEDQLRLRMLSTLRVSPATGYIKASILACVRCYYRCLPATRFRRTGMATLNTSRLYQGSSISVWEKSLEIQKAVQCLGFSSRLEKPTPWNASWSNNILDIRLSLVSI